MKEWAGVLRTLFNFREIRYFDIEGQVTGVKSKAMTSPCGKIRIPINEEGKEQAGQIQEYLDSVPRRGHPAHRDGLDDAAAARWTRCAPTGVKLLDTIDTYYELVDKRIPGHGERPGSAAAAQDPDRRQEGRAAAADLQREPDRADLLRVHPAQGRRGLRRTATSRRCSKASSSTRCAAGC